MKRSTSKVENIVDNKKTKEEDEPIENPATPDQTSTSEDKQGASTENKASEPAVYQWKEIEEHNSFMYVYSSVETLVTDKKTYLFDMDNTITKYDKKNPLANPEFLYSTTKDTLQKLADNGDHIIICSNQGGVAAKKATLKEVKDKIEKFVKLFSFPIIVCIAPYNDYFRKPSPAMFLYVNKTYCNNTLTKENALYVGDAAGRKNKKPKDFSSDDLCFALNCDIPFQTPEVFFNKDTSSINVDVLNNTPEFNPKSLKDKTYDKSILTTMVTTTDPQEIVLIVGPPASGKSTISTTYFSTYDRINQDTYKTIKKCLSVARTSLTEGKSIIIDNTNRDKNTRSQWIELAKEFKIPIRCLLMTLEKPICMHLSVFRTGNIWREENRKVPDMIIHAFYKNMEKPTVQEGFKSVLSIPFIPGPFKCKEEENLFYCYL
ncbi:hypothetical protein WA158_007293 [Blastocystis sp. Blastoise]